MKNRIEKIYHGDTELTEGLKGLFGLYGMLKSWSADQPALSDVASAKSDNQ